MGDPRKTTTRVWLGEDIFSGLEYWQWCDDDWYGRCEGPLSWGDVFILKSDRPKKPKRKPGLVRACYSRAGLSP